MSTRQYRRQSLQIECAKVVHHLASSAMEVARLHHATYVNLGTIFQERPSRLVLPVQPDLFCQLVTKHLACRAPH